MCETAKAQPQDLLTWYDRHARDLPWRVGPAARQAGVIPDPYHVWLSEIMLQQTTVAAVKSYFETFTSRWPRVQDLAASDDADVMAAWAGLGYYARARNLLKCARQVTQDLGGVFPSDVAGLQKLPGIGPYTSAAIAAIAFDQPATVVDGNVERVMARLHGVQTPLPDAKPELTALAAGLSPDTRPGDYAQAVMDLGATICTPRKPACGLCPWRAPCVARQEGNPERLPAKRRKAPKPIRYGVVFIGRNAAGDWLLERRPEKGLLGGMLGWPGSDWTEGTAPAANAPCDGSWQVLEGEVRHTFTHFHLRLSLKVGEVHSAPEGAEMVPAALFDPKSLPTVMRKAHALAADWFTS
ncbi:MAG: A/G-specific adenine glycosylase [Mangrovicoccus sp.]|nr:A/G-specific adenine glycosylase [Mangrovicoccus sp.]